MKKIIRILTKYFINKSIIDIWFPSKKKKNYYFTKKRRKLYEKRNVYR